MNYMWNVGRMHWNGSRGVKSRYSIGNVYSSAGNLGAGMFEYVHHHRDGRTELLMEEEEEAVLPRTKKRLNNVFVET